MVDGTLGLGGHSSALMKAVGPTGHLYAFDGMNGTSRLQGHDWKVSGNISLFFTTHSAL